MQPENASIEPETISEDLAESTLTDSFTISQTEMFTSMPSHVEQDDVKSDVLTKTFFDLNLS